MPSDEPEGPLHGLPTAAVRVGESVLHHWGAPEGRGIVTSQRCLLLGHPRPLHREIVWERDLEKIEQLEVVALSDDPEVVAFVQQSLAGGAKRGDPTAGVINCEYKIVVDGVSMYVGNAAKCGEIQAWVDDARTQRSMALFGRILPCRT